MTHKSGKGGKRKGLSLWKPKKYYLSKPQPVFTTT